MMCEYCKLLSGDRKVLEEDGKTELVIGRTNKDYYIETENSCDSVDIDINYCPFCGRKLNEQDICADEMMKEIGYEKVSDDKYSIEYRKILDDDLFKINFWKEDKTISNNYYRDMCYITLQELQAINKKCQELGWIKED